MTIKNGSLVKEANGISVQVGSGFVTTDGVNPSPLTLGASGLATIVVPDEDCELILYPVSNDLQVSEDSGLTSYDLVTKGNKEPFPCARMSEVYIHGTSGDTIYYRFHYV